MTAPAAALGAYFLKWSEPKLGLAVSGGGDSIALLRLAADWAAEAGVALAAATVDHGLRAEAPQEAQFVAQLCAELGVSHDTLGWTGWDGAGNLQDRARQARYDLLADWAVRRGIGAVALAHTQDDQAETFLMRLARASGVDGLSAMADRQVGPVRFLRPLMSVSRADLRAYLTGQGQSWIEDPSNADPTYERVQMRQQSASLARVGITAQVLSDVAGNMAQARTALNWATHAFSQQHLRMNGPDVTIDRAGFLTLPAELQRRLMVHVVKWLSASEYAPRRQPVAALIQAAIAQERMTLHGCTLTHRKGGLYLHREYAAVQGLSAPAETPWDGRWVLSGPDLAGARVAALGRAGLDQLPDWRQQRRPEAAMMADPAVWLEDRLIAAPLSGAPNGWSAEPAQGRLDCHSALLSH